MQYSSWFRNPDAAEGKNVARRGREADKEECEFKLNSKGGRSTLSCEQNVVPPLVANHAEPVGLYIHITDG